MATEVEAKGFRRPRNSIWRAGAKARIEVEVFDESIKLSIDDQPTSKPVLTTPTLAGGSISRYTARFEIPGRGHIELELFARPGKTTRIKLLADGTVEVLEPIEARNYPLRSALR